MSNLKARFCREKNLNQLIKSFSYLKSMNRIPENLVLYATY